MPGVEHDVKNTDLFIFPLKISQPAAGCGLCWKDSLSVFLCSCCSPVTVTGVFLFPLLPLLSDSLFPCRQTRTALPWVFFFPLCSRFSRSLLQGSFAP